MYAVETLKRSVERVTGIAKLTPGELRSRLRARKARTWRFKDDGATPNNPLRFVLFRGPLKISGSTDPAALFEQLFAANGWGDSWRNGIYDYLHYHSRIHEVLGVARGRARVRFGGDHGRVVTVTAGDVAILPAGTGHHCLEASDDFLVVGAYPPTGTYDECRGSAAEHARAIKTIPRVARPRKDPVYGAGGPLLRLWPKAQKIRRTRATTRGTAPRRGKQQRKRRAPSRRR
jgi:uncharacterized protein YjlB